MPGYHTKREEQWRRAFAAVVKPKEFRVVVSALLEHAKKGDAWAVKYLLDRCLGTTVQELHVQADASIAGERTLHLDFSD